MAEILINQSDMNRIFKRLERDYDALNKRQQAYAIREIGRVRSELTEFLAEYADDNGIISRRRASMIVRDLDGIERAMRRNGDLALENIIEETSEWTTSRLNKSLGISLSASQFDRINRHT